MIIPFAQGINAGQFAPLAHGAALITGTDQAQTRLQQVAYIPNKLNDTAPYDWLEPTGAPLLDPLDVDHPFVKGALQKHERHQQQQRQKAELATMKPRSVSGTEDGIIDQVNAAYTLSEVLETFGYARKGQNLHLAPDSGSGIAGVYILTSSNGTERAYSHHSSDPLADGHAHDIFSVLTTLQFKDDQTAAVRHFANELDPKGQKQRQREYMRQQESERPQDTHTDQANENWPQLVEFGDDSPELLPVHLWPNIMRDFAAGVSDETETPPDLAAILTLGAMAASVQRLADVCVKPGYFEPLCLYTVAALPPALRKSAVFKKVTKPFTSWEAQQREAIAPEILIAESKAKTHQDRVKELRKKAAKASSEEDANTLANQVADLEKNAPKIPSIPQIWTSDTTTEEAARLLSQNGEAGAVMSGEGGIFETMAGRYASGVPNIDLYLNGHAGDPMRINRSGKAPIQMDNPRLSMVLAVQPDVIQGMSTKPGFSGRGLLGRFLYVVPASNLGKRTGENQPMNEGAAAAYTARIHELLTASAKTKRKDGRSSTIELSRSAFDSWKMFWHQVERELAEGGDFEHCRDWGGKLAGAVARIAGVFHFARHGAGAANSSVSADDMTAAVATGRALCSHALAVFNAMGADPDIEDAKAILRWAKRHNLTEFTGRDCYKGNRSRFPRSADINQGIAVLVERGYIRMVNKKSEGPGRPQNKIIEINPSALRL